MIAYELRDGVAVPCEDFGPVRKVPIVEPIHVLPLRYTKRERRRLARMGTRGRRGAKAVPRRRPPPRWTPMRVEVQRGHLLSIGALLYLPEGVDVTQEHIAAVAKRWRMDRRPWKQLDNT